METLPFDTDETLPATLSEETGFLKLEDWLDVTVFLKLEVWPEVAGFLVAEVLPAVFEEETFALTMRSEVVLSTFIVVPFRIDPLENEEELAATARLPVVVLPLPVMATVLPVEEPDELVAPLLYLLVLPLPPLRAPEALFRP